MKKLLFVLLIPALTLMTSCGGSDDDGILSQMKKMKEMADNVKEMQKEIEANPEEQDVVFKESLLKQLNLTATDRLIPDEVWERVRKTTDDFLAMDSVQLAEMNRETLNTFFVDHGYSDTQSANEELERIGQLAEFTVGAAIQSAVLMQERIVNGDEGYEKALKEYADALNKDGYSADDLRVIEKNADLSANAMAVRLSSEAIYNKEEIMQAVDSTQALLDTAVSVLNATKTDITE